MSKPDFLPHSRLQSLVDTLIAQGYQCIGPQVRDNSIHYAPMKDVKRLPWGAIDQQSPGNYSLTQGEKQQAFAWANGASSIKPFLFQAQETVWKVVRDTEGKLQFKPTIQAEPMALFGVRPCDIAAMLIQDRVFLEGEYIDPSYQAKRQKLLTIVVNCSYSADTCFCVSAGFSPKASHGFDLSMTELAQGFIIEAATKKGQDVLKLLALSSASSTQITEGKQRIEQAINKQTRYIPSIEKRKTAPDEHHPCWDKIADQCIECGSCTQVCPTCFCHQTMDFPLFDEEGSEHIRSWDSCFSENHGYTHGHHFRKGKKARYQQWITHKFIEWQTQFKTEGCVGCGRCISWCPAKIDVTQVLKALYDKE